MGSIWGKMPRSLRRNYLAKKGLVTVKIKYYNKNYYNKPNLFGEKPDDVLIQNWKLLCWIDEPVPGARRCRPEFPLVVKAYLAQDAAAETSFLSALALEPGNRDYLYATVDFYMKRGRLADARIYAEQLVARYPAWSTGHNLLTVINRSAPAEKTD